MPDENKSSTLGDQIKSAQESIRSWPEWMRDAAKFSGQPRTGNTPGPDPVDQNTKKDPRP